MAAGQGNDLKRLAKNRLTASAANYKTSMKKKKFNRPSKKFANLNTTPDRAPRSAVHPNNETGATAKVPGGNSKASPKQFHRHHEVPQNGNKFRRIR